MSRAQQPVITAPTQKAPNIAVSVIVVHGKPFRPWCLFANEADTALMGEKLLILLSGDAVGFLDVRAVLGVRAGHVTERVVQVTRSVLLDPDLTATGDALP